MTTSKCRRLKLFGLSLLPVAMILQSPLPLQAEYNPVDRVTISSTGIDTDGISGMPRISVSDDGRFVVFQSIATNLIPRDANGLLDVFLYDRTLKVTERVSVSSLGEEANGESRNASVSPDGRFVVFESSASNLVSGDTNGVDDIFIRDRTAGITSRISVSTLGEQAKGPSRNARVSADGRYVVFESDAKELVSGDTNDVTDIFLHDRISSTTTRLSVRSDGMQATQPSTGPAISADGAVVAFVSAAKELVSLDNNNVADVFVHIPAAGITTRASVNSITREEANGASAAVAVSADGLYVAFQSDATNLVSLDQNGVTDIFYYVVDTGSLQRVSLEPNGAEADGPSRNPSLSSTGRYVLFESDATDLADDKNGVTDLFVRDVTASTTTRVSVTQFGEELDEALTSAALNSNANFVAFVTPSDIFLPTDRNELEDVYVINLQCRLSPAGVTPLDTDGDGADDCTDICPTDNTKITSTGQCGCGVAETDTDGDGAADCVDECPVDATKTSAGACGCAVAETDANGNGVADCLDPTSSTKPKKATVQRLNSRTVRVLAPTSFQNVRYEFVLERNGSTVSRKKGSSPKVKFTTSGSGYTVKYRVFVKGGATSRFSAKSKVPK